MATGHGKRTLILYFRQTLGLALVEHQHDAIALHLPDLFGCEEINHVALRACGKIAFNDGGLPPSFF